MDIQWIALSGLRTTDPWAITGLTNRAITGLTNWAMTGLSNFADGLDAVVLSGYLC